MAKCSICSKGGSKVLGVFRDSRKFQDTPGSVMKLQDAPGCSRMLQEAPGSSRMLQNAPGSCRKLQKALRSSRKLQECYMQDDPRCSKILWDVLGCFKMSGTGSRMSKVENVSGLDAHENRPIEMQSIGTWEHSPFLHGPWF